MRFPDDSAPSAAILHVVPHSSSTPEAILSGRSRPQRLECSMPVAMSTQSSANYTNFTVPSRCADPAALRPSLTSSLASLASAVSPARTSVPAASSTVTSSCLSNETSCTPWCLALAVAISSSALMAALSLMAWWSGRERRGEVREKTLCKATHQSGSEWLRYSSDIPLSSRTGTLWHPGGSSGGGGRGAEREREREREREGEMARDAGEEEGRCQAGEECEGRVVVKRSGFQGEWSCAGRVVLCRESGVVQHVEMVRPSWKTH